MMAYVLSELPVKDDGKIDYYISKKQTTKHQEPVLLSSFNFDIFSMN